MQFRQNIPASGMTLVELLVTIGVIGLMMALVLPAVSTLSTSRGSANSLFELTRGVELARSEALAAQTYTWLAVMNTTDGGGRVGVSFSVFVSNDGTPAVAAGNLSALTRPVFLPDLRIVPIGSIQSDVRATMAEGAVDVVQADLSLEAVNGTVDYGAGSSYAMVFSPSGELLLAVNPTPATPFERWVALSVATLRGEDRAEEFDAIIQIAGGSGQVQVLRK